MASAEVGPPTSGVPVPGQKAGSTKSTSNVKYAGPEPTRLRTKSAYAAGPSSRSSIQGRIVMPRSRETWESPGP